MNKLILLFTFFLLNSCHVPLWTESREPLSLRELTEQANIVLYIPAGDYIFCQDVYLSNLSNVSIIGRGEVNFHKCDNFNGEYLLQILNSNNVLIKNINFFGNTLDTNKYQWGEQGLLCAGCSKLQINGNQFYNFGDAAIRVTSSTGHLSGASINSTRVDIINNYFENVTQVTTTHPWTTRFGGVDKIHIANNIFNKLKGGVKLASRSYVEKATISGNIFYANKGTAIESVYYSKVQIKNNMFINNDGFILNVYPNKTENVSTRIDWQGISFIENIIIGAKKGLLFQSDVVGEYSSSNIITNIAITNNYFFTTNLSAEPVKTRYLFNFFSMGPKYFDAVEVKDNFIGALPCKYLIKHEVPMLIENNSRGKLNRAC
ncbi:right-handed parallel beta-helix repeat-containing protein [Pseudoalteromonas sp. MMG010]|uniref:right-handed parallel beta-helix repeat-containing protein n=1 Tax=Pseudoalteromonas sp. MMG010 TaxID=2822685 RepID=UPI001B3A57F0|nr:right-handed parallel beta-helix repeat-containing protein [Pseudoalteromonas sp. MMG010]MBQ4834137.1 right-handed parallel beta-helix repeat-containing protein [Pseudoalteromonas sp. MMG010]